MLVGPSMIRALAARQIGQNVRGYGPQSHLAKQGTRRWRRPDLVAMLCSTCWADLGNRHVWIVGGVTLAFGLIGFTTTT